MKFVARSLDFSISSHGSRGETPRTRWNCVDASGDAVFADLVARYGEPQRHYHTLVHIDACLVWLDWFSSTARHPEEVELALWFHDAVYDPDLTILGASMRDFDRFEAEIRREYAHVSERDYRVGRRLVLEGFSSRAEIYSVAKVREELETRARANLRRRIEELSRGSLVMGPR